MTDDALQRKAAELELDRLVAAHPDDLRRALANGAALSEKIPRDLAPSEEAAHIFKCTTPGKRPS